MMLIKEGLFATTYALNDKVIKIFKKKSKKIIEAWFLNRLSGISQRTIFLKTIDTPPPFKNAFVSCYSLFDATLEDIFLRKYKLSQAMFIIKELQNACHFLFFHHIVHTDLSPSNVLINIKLKNNKNTTLYQEPVEIEITNLVVAGFDLAVDVKHNTAGRENVKFDRDTVHFWGLTTTTTCVRPPELYRAKTRYTRFDIYKLDSWSFGVVAALILHYTNNDRSRYDALILNLKHIYSPIDRLKALWNDVKKIKEETQKHSHLFHRYLLPVKDRSVITYF